MFARVHTYNNCIILIPESSQNRKPLPCIWLVGLPSLRSWRNIWILIKALRGSSRTSQITQKVSGNLSHSPLLSICAFYILPNPVRLCKWWSYGLG
jgi:hypothetical protein